MKTILNTTFPGRGVILGQTHEGTTIAAVVLTSLSPSSSHQSCRLTYDEKTSSIKSEPTDSKVNPRHNERLSYPAIIMHKNGIILGSGSHTTGVLEQFKKTLDPEKAITAAHEQYAPEQDSRYTPRITAIAGATKAAFGLITGDYTKTTRQTTPTILTPGKTAILTTNNGSRDNIKPHTGPPKAIKLYGNTPEEIAEHIWKELAEGNIDLRGNTYPTGTPKQNFDSRISVAVVMRKPNGETTHHIINTHDTNRAGEGPYHPPKQYRRHA